MNPEERKKYNETYYATQKTKIMEKLFEKEICDNCGRCVCHQRLNKHKKTKYCSERKKYNDVDLQKMREIILEEERIKNLPIV